MDEKRYDTDIVCVLNKNRVLFSFIQETNILHEVFQTATLYGCNWESVQQHARLRSHLLILF